MDRNVLKLSIGCWNMNLAERAYEELYDSPSPYRMDLKFHGKIRGYNATVSQRGNHITFRLSRKFEDCEPEIKIGIMQFLLNRLKKTKINTDNIEFYHTFVKKMSDFAPVTKTDDILEESFQRVNDEYLGGMMSQPNLVWGRRTTTLLGTYEHGTDTITISKVLLEAPEELLDFVMYHEMLHKKHKFSCSAGRTHSHTKAFKAEEATYSVKNAEQMLTKYLHGERRKKTPKKGSFLSRVMGWT